MSLPSAPGAGSIAKEVLEGIHTAEGIALLGHLLLRHFLLRHLLRFARIAAVGGLGLVLPGLLDLLLDGDLQLEGLVLTVNRKLQLIADADAADGFDQMMSFSWMPALAAGPSSTTERTAAPLGRP